MLSGKILVAFYTRAGFRSLSYEAKHVTFVTKPFPRNGISRTTALWPWD